MHQIDPSIIRPRFVALNKMHLRLHQLAPGNQMTVCSDPYRVVQVKKEQRLWLLPAFGICKSFIYRFYLLWFFGIALYRNYIYCDIVEWEAVKAYTVQSNIHSLIYPEQMLAQSFEIGMISLM